MAEFFDAKVFNGEAFGRYVKRVPQPNKNALIKSKVLVGDAEIKRVFGSQTGTFFSVLPFKGLLGGEEVNYDGGTDITVDSTDTYKQGVVVFGRAKAWTEKDFSQDITGGVDFMDNVAEQVGTYWDEKFTGTLMSVIKGIFSMTGAKNLEFVNGHTYDATKIGDGKVSPTTLNSALQQASGDKKAKFSLVFMHSAVATELENQKLLKFLTQTDADGIERPLPLAAWNGRLVVVDDGMPAEEVTEGEETYTKYTTYVFGEGAIVFEDLGVKKPFAMTRDELKNGGQDTLVSRTRKCFAPHGISFTNKSVAKLSPTNAEFENGANWELVNNGQSGSALKVYDHKEIAIARIYTRG